MVFVNSEISKQYSILSKRLTGFKYRTTCVHQSSGDSKHLPWLRPCYSGYLLLTVQKEEEEGEPEM